MDIISQSDTDFFLTGGTALSRAYYNHRYSDDLDFFLNQSQTYDEQVDEILDLLQENGYSWSTTKMFARANHFTTLMVRKDSELSLKLDFVNDLVPHFGDTVETELFHRTDSIWNILSNKLSAIFRFEAKDIADIREIALRESVNWAQAINDARQKEAGVELHYVSQIMTGIPESEYKTINWTNDPGWDVFMADIEIIAFEMLNG